MSASEELREALLDLEEARNRESRQRRTAEALLAGLRAVVLTQDPQALFRKLFDAMREPLEFDAAAVLVQGDDANLRPVAASAPFLLETVWPVQAMLQRVIEGRPVAVFDTGKVAEWRAQPEQVRDRVRSALHFAMPAVERSAVFVCTHGERAHFSRDHVTLARRFSFLAGEALRKVESEARVADLEQRLETEARVAELNLRLAESEKKLARARKMEALGLLAGGVAHDLNNILSGLVGYPDLLLRGNELGAQGRAAVEVIRDSGLRAAAIVDDLLTVARGVASARDPMNLNDVVESYLASPEYQQLVRRYPLLRVRSRCEPGLLTISASSLHVRKALMNLVGNSAEATDQRTQPRVTIVTENRYLDRPLKAYEDVRAGEYAVLRVIDNGVGIAESDLERIFEPFYAKKAMGCSGTGLGLTIVWNTVQDHDGYVDVNTGADGTEFALYFPITREPVKGVAPRKPSSSLRGKGELVLVIDDLPDQRQLACAMLEKLGYRAEAVSGGEEAVTRAAQGPIDALVLDMIMDPGIGGRETYERISRIHPGQKAVLASGFSRTEEVKAAQAAGAGPYVRKPYTLEKLGAALRAVLDG